MMAPGERVEYTDAKGVVRRCTVVLASHTRVFVRFDPVPGKKMPKLPVFFDADEFHILRPQTCSATTTRMDAPVPDTCHCQLAAGHEGDHKCEHGFRF